MVFIIVLLFAVVFIIANLLLKREEKKETKSKSEERRPIFNNPSNPLIKIGRDEEKKFHPSHTWVLTDSETETAYISFDALTANLFTSNTSVKDLPELGSNIEQGEKIWEIGAGNRTIQQKAPVSGKIVAINSGLYSEKLNTNDASCSWLIKVKPNNLKKELENLVSSAKAAVINENIFNSLKNDLLGAYQNDGGELTENFINEISDEDWELIKHKYLQ